MDPMIMGIYGSSTSGMVIAVDFIGQFGFWINC